MPLLTANLSGDSWHVSAPDGSRVVTDDGWPWRQRLVIPGVLAPLSAWEVIEAARCGLYGLRVVGHSAHGTSSYVACAEAGGEMPLFGGGAPGPNDAREP